LRRPARTLLEHAARRSPRTKYHRDFPRNLLKRWPALSTFTHTDGVEPTNNHAERGLRGAGIYRKLSLGSHPNAANAPSNDSSTSVTCRLRKQSLCAYLTQALAAHARGDPVPALT
jgi:transposase